jgi:hypothetical protein
MFTGWDAPTLDRTKMGIVREVVRQMHVQARRGGSGGTGFGTGKRR